MALKQFRTDRQRDDQAREVYGQDYEKYGEVGHDLLRLEEKVLDMAWNEYVLSKGQMAPTHRKWDEYNLRYRSKWKEAEDTTPFSEINPPKIARMIDIHVARTTQGVIPDRSRLDFFQFVPETDYEGEPPDPNAVEYAQAAMNGVRNDMIKCGYVRTTKDSIKDYFMLGNAVQLATWDLKIQYRHKRVPNPKYDPMNPFVEEIVDGEVVKTAVSPEIVIREAYREFDAPEIRYINPRNVFPTEMDRASLEDCTAVMIYDTVRMADLLDEEIKTGGKLYANLSRLQFSDQRYDVSEVADQSWSARDENGYMALESTRKFDRVTRIGRFRLQELMSDIGVDDEAHQQKLIEAAADKFDWDLTKIEGWDTWFIEIVDEGLAMVRWQPSPFLEDRKNIIHAQLFKTANSTWAEGIYDRCWPEEAAGNAFKRYYLELILRSARPFAWIDRSAVDEKWRMENGDNYGYSPNGIGWLKQGRSANEAVQFQVPPQGPIQYADVAVSTLALDMSEAGHLPPVKMGSATGGATASEINNMGSSSDIILQEFLLDLEDTLLKPGISWILKLHHQFTRETRTGYQVDPRGDAVLSTVEPDVWLCQYRVNLMGFQTVGNLAVRLMNFKEGLTWAQSTGRLNVDVAMIEYFKMLGMKNAAAMISPPQPPPPPFLEKLSLSIPLTPEMIGPDATTEILSQAGLNVTPSMAAQMGSIAKSNELAQVYEASKERDEADMASGGILSSNAPDGGSPAGVPEAQPSNYADGSHHAPGEVENRQRGLKDEKGAMATMTQKLRSPANSRRAQS